MRRQRSFQHKMKDFANQFPCANKAPKLTMNFHSGTSEGCPAFGLQNAEANFFLHKS